MCIIGSTKKLWLRKHWKEDSKSRVFSDQEYFVVLSQFSDILRNAGRENTTGVIEGTKRKTLK